VRYQGGLAGIAGRPAEQMALKPGATLGELIEAIWQRRPALKAAALPDGGSVASMVRWFVNGRAQSLDAPLHAGDEVSVIPGAAGG